MGKYIRAMVAVVALVASMQGQAITVGFSFGSDGSSLFSGTSIPGSVTGVISGLLDNTADQLAGIRVEVLTYPALLSGSLDSGPVASDWSVVNGAGFDVLNGELVGAEFLAQSSSGGADWDQLRLDYVFDFNWFTLDRGTTYTGNNDAFGGVTYTTLATVSEPGLLGLMLLGLGALGARRRSSQR